jgi:16S rRNA processing protein RimM
VSAELHTASPERFAACKRLFAQDANGHRRELSLENSWAHKALVVLKFSGVDSISAAESLVGCEIQVPRQERGTLPAGEVYVSDLVGCVLRDRGRDIGTITGVQFGSGDAPLLVVKAAGQEHLVPFAEAYLRRIDVEHKLIEMELPEGLLQLEAPRSQKQRRRRGRSGSQ